MLPAAVTEKLDALPVQPGVYLFKDKKGAVVYVGKAKSLRSRVRSYFQSGTSDEQLADAAVSDDVLRALGAEP